MERQGAMVRRNEDVEEGGKGPNGGKVVVRSCNVKALYPSLKKKECAEVVGRLVSETEMEIVNVNYEEVGMAISMLAKWADKYKWGLQGLCPERKWKRGARRASQWGGKRNSSCWQSLWNWW